LGPLSMEPQDAVEALRRRLMVAIDSAPRIQIEQQQGESVSGERIRQVARAI